MSRVESSRGGREAGGEERRERKEGRRERERERQREPSMIILHVNTLSGCQSQTTRQLRRWWPFKRSVSSPSPLVLSLLLRRSLSRGQSSQTLTLNRSFTAACLPSREVTATSFPSDPSLQPQSAAYTASVTRRSLLELIARLATGVRETEARTSSPCLSLCLSSQLFPRH